MPHATKSSDTEREQAINTPICCSGTQESYRLMHRRLPGLILFKTLYNTCSLLCGLHISNTHTILVTALSNLMYFIFLTSLSQPRNEIERTEVTTLSKRKGNQTRGRALYHGHFKAEP